MIFILYSQDNLVYGFSLDRDFKNAHNQSCVVNLKLKLIVIVIVITIAIAIAISIAIAIVIVIVIKHLNLI